MSSLWLERLVDARTVASCSPDGLHHDLQMPLESKELVIVQDKPRYIGICLTTKNLLDWHIDPFLSKISFQGSMAEMISKAAERQWLRSATQEKDLRTTCCTCKCTHRGSSGQRMLSLSDQLVVLRGIWPVFDAVHDAENPEYSILKQRLARTLKADGYNEASVQKLDLITLTKVDSYILSIDSSDFVLHHNASSASLPHIQVWWPPQVHKPPFFMIVITWHDENSWVFPIHNQLKKEQQLFSLQGYPSHNSRTRKMLVSIYHENELSDFCR